MNRIHLSIMAALAGLLALSAPAAAERIRLVNINGYSVIDNEHLVLNGGASHHYLVTLRHRCPGLRFGVEVGLSFPSTTTLYTPFLEYVYTRDDVRCFIDTIEPVDSLDAARALIEERAAAESAAEAQGPAAPDA
ncbi:DUF6491 family protein [uncultured Maricaulis sp.]|uniref:DUF6491 family protein n=1 Tax=uncultured Maricaulis sp. TaxID=174710 RepID=UPI0030DA1D1D|tara:strand:+ start:25393 stop:25797 length:405 start_codon:yes stop_codon:yes gene_type:complete